MTTRRHFLGILAAAIGSLGCQFGRRERFLPKAPEISWNYESFYCHHLCSELPVVKPQRGMLWNDLGIIKLSE